MSISFDENYIRNSCYSIAMIVANPVVNDSRVLKTAYSLNKMGFKVHLYGLNTEPKIKKVEGYPFDITLISNPRFEMKKKGAWWVDDKSYDIATFLKKMAEGFSDLIAKEKHDILHTHDMYGLPIGALLRETTSSKNVPWIHDLHEYVEGCTNLPDFQRLFVWEQEKKYIHLPDSLTTVSPILADLISKDYNVERPALILNTPRITDFDNFNPRTIRSALNIKPDIPLMVYNGGVKPPRGVQFAVKALADLDGVHLALLTNSSGDFMDELIQMAKNAGTEDRLHIHPFVPNNEVTSFVCDATLGVNPVTVYENSDLALPNKVFEYIHAGVPIASSSTTMMEQFISENKCGQTFEAGNVAQLTSAVKDIIKNFPNGLPNANENSVLAKRYCWEEQEKILGQEYEKLLNKLINKASLSNKNKIGSILHLPTHAASQPGTLATALSKLGVISKSAALGANKFNYRQDILIKPLPFNASSIKSYFKDQRLDAFDVFHYHCRPLIFSKDYKKPTGSDLVYLKLLNKKVFFNFRGSEIRLASLFKTLSPYNYVGEKSENQDASMPFAFDEVKQKRFRDLLLKICDDVFVNDPELQCYVPNSTIVPRAIDFDDIDENDSLSNDKASLPLVVHAPSRSNVKGTKYIIEAVNKLKKEGLTFNFELIENLTHIEAKKKYKQADIIIDQLRIGWYGVLAVEGMAMSKAVVSYVRHDLRHYLPHPSPMAYASPENVTDVLRYLIKNPAKCLEYGKAGYDFVYKYHNAKTIAKLLTDLYAIKNKEVDCNAALELLDKNALDVLGDLNVDGMLQEKIRKLFFNAIKNDINKKTKNAIKSYDRFTSLSNKNTLMESYALRRSRYLQGEEA
ncbi:hypothetical aminotransferase, class-II [Halomonas citrativorans]|uniref:Hypothetical aminotransferase, class-II n=1 Tax=Halomonas citrativorans TaxID=2742612 RepID=A0A1R4HV98_9GAMM|nr:glycosyltransferase [Halomonas citrativorans]SJN11472.1 hypothetical aminotransferase, class-II [Halomonas citrativorans]